MFWQFFLTTPHNIYIYIYRSIQTNSNILFSLKKNKMKSGWEFEISFLMQWLSCLFLLLSFSKLRGNQQFSFSFPVCYLTLSSLPPPKKKKKNKTSLIDGLWLEYIALSLTSRKMCPKFMTSYRAQIVLFSLTKYYVLLLSLVSTENYLHLSSLLGEQSFTEHIIQKLKVTVDKFLYKPYVEITIHVFLVSWWIVILLYIRPCVHLIE